MLDKGQRNGVVPGSSSSSIARAARSSNCVPARSSGAGGSRSAAPCYVGPGQLFSGGDHDFRREAWGPLPRALRQGEPGSSAPRGCPGELSSRHPGVDRRLNASGRFRVSMGDAINVYLAQESIKGEDFIQGKGTAGRPSGSRSKTCSACISSGSRAGPTWKCGSTPSPEDGSAGPAGRSSCRRPSSAAERRPGGSPAAADPPTRPRRSSDPLLAPCSAGNWRSRGRDSYHGGLKGNYIPAGSRAIHLPRARHGRCGVTPAHRIPARAGSATGIRSTCTRSSTSAWSRNGRVGVPRRTSRRAHGPRWRRCARWLWADRTTRRAG